MEIRGGIVFSFDADTLSIPVNVFEKIFDMNIFYDLCRKLNGLKWVFFYRTIVCYECR